MRASFFAALAGLTIVSSSPLEERAPLGCIADNCLRALTVDNSNLSTLRPIMAKADCATFGQSISTVTVTPTTTTVFQTQITITSTTSTVITTGTVTSTIIVPTVVVVTAAPQAPQVTPRAIPRLEGDLLPRDVATSLPSYLSPCSSLARFWSACSCAGFAIGTTVTSTLTTPTTTVTIESTSTIAFLQTSSVTATASATIFSTSTSSSSPSSSSPPSSKATACALTAELGSNLISDPGFETTGSTAWQLLGAVIDSTVSNSGTSSAKLLGAQDTSYINQFVSFSTSESFSVSFAAKFTGTSSTGCFWFLGIETGSLCGGLLSDEFDWTCFNTSFQTSSEAENQILFVFSCGDGASAWWIDDVSVEVSGD